MFKPIPTNILKLTPKNQDPNDENNYFVREINSGTYTKLNNIRNKDYKSSTSNLPHTHGYEDAEDYESNEDFQVFDVQGAYANELYNRGIEVSSFIDLKRKLGKGLPTEILFFNHPKEAYNITDLSPNVKNNRNLDSISPNDQIYFTFKYEDFLNNNQYDKNEEMIIAKNIQSKSKLSSLINFAKNSTGILQDKKSNQVLFKIKRKLIPLEKNDKNMDFIIDEVLILLNFDIIFGSNRFLTAMRDNKYLYLIHRHVPINLKQFNKIIDDNNLIWTKNSIKNLCLQLLNQAQLLWAIYGLEIDFSEENILVDNQNGFVNFWIDKFKVGPRYVLHADENLGKDYLDWKILNPKSQPKEINLNEKKSVSNFGKLISKTIHFDNKKGVVLYKSKSENFDRFTNELRFGGFGFGFDF